MYNDGGGIIGIIILLMLAFIGFVVYLVFKQLEFIIRAIDLYEKMVTREDTIITLLSEIKENQLAGGNNNPNVPIKGKITNTSKRIIPGNQESVQSSSDVSEEQRHQTSPEIKVYQRGSDLEENAKVDDNQEVENDAIPIRVRRIDEQPSYEATLKFHCASCHKLYEVDAKSLNCIFRCIKCENQMMVHINR